MPFHCVIAAVPSPIRPLDMDACERNVSRASNIMNNVLISNNPSSILDLLQMPAQSASSAAWLWATPAEFT